MTLQIYPFSASESKIDGLRIINVKMVTDDRGTVRELYRCLLYTSDAADE